VRHLDQTAAREPGALAEVWQHRHGTLVRSLDYLEELAGRYARLAPARRRERCDPGAIAAEAALGDGRVTVQADPATPAVLADPVALRRILDNLLRNAREALPDGRGTITVTVAPGPPDPDRPEGPRPVVLTVADDGVGMPPEVRDRVGEDFFTTKPDGTGLGLSNVRRLAGDAGGHLQIASEPGGGTAVTITFPAPEDAP
jgi:signal transduction histidine kinase